MVGNVQSSRTSGGRLGKAAIKAKEIEKGTYESLLYQHNTKPLLHAVWADNNFVKTLSNFHSPTIVIGGMKRRVRDAIASLESMSFAFSNAFCCSSPHFQFNLPVFDAILFNGANVSDRFGQR
jgi:hypothetical protein